MREHSKVRAKVRAEERAQVPRERKAAPAPDAGGDQRFRVLVQSIKDYAIFMVDPGGHVQTWNTGAKLLKGWEREEIVGKSIATFYTPEDLASGLPGRLLGEAVSLGHVENEGWRVRKDGSRFWADVIITALHDDEGRLSGFAKVTRDLTERRNADQERRRREEELVRSEERFRLLVEAVEDYAIFMLDPQGNVATWNSGAERIKGYLANEIIGRHFSCFRTAEEVDAGKCEEELETARRRGKVEEEGWRVRKDGSKFWANVALTALRSPSGELVGFAKVTRDLTDRRRLEEERLNRARAEEAARLREEFLAIASHELKTPLTTVQIELQGLSERSRELDQRTVTRLGRASRNADRLAALIESLLDVSRISAGKLVFKVESFDLAQALEQVVDSMRGAAARARCDLAFEASGPVVGSWDRLRVEQVVMNIVWNALKYGAAKPITVSVSTDSAEACIEVKDGGPGISEPDLQRIFGRFERASSMRHYGGLGLGLYVSREIVEALGGTIEAGNLAGGGACFTVRLPRQSRPRLASPVP